MEETGQASLLVYRLRRRQAFLLVHTMKRGGGWVSEGFRENWQADLAGGETEITNEG